MNRLVMILLKNILILPWAYGKLCYYAKHTDKYPYKVKFDHIRWMMQRAIKAGNLDLQVYGLENLPQEDGYLLYGNHQGMFDVVAIAGTCPASLAVVFKKELANVPLLKQIVQCTHSYAMDREDVRQSLEVIRGVTEEVKAGRNFVIFPEGTRSKLGNTMVDFHSGSFRCAIKAKCPVVPMALVNSFRVLDEKGCKPLTVQLHYLTPITYEEYKDMKTGELADLVKARIQAVLDQQAT